MYHLYRGHGSASQWVNVGFGTLNFKDIYKSFELPIVLSITCHAGSLTSSSGFARNLLTLADSGASGVIAASSTSISLPNDALTFGIFKHWFDISDLQMMINNKAVMIPATKSYCGPTLGELLHNGVEVMKDLTPIVEYKDDVIGSVSYNTKIYHVFGDPSMFVHSSKPLVNKINNINFNHSRYEHTTTHSFDFGSLDISVEKPSVISVTDRRGYNYTFYGTEAYVKEVSLPLDIVITGHNLRPLEYRFDNGTLSGYSDLLNWRIKSLSPNPSISGCRVRIGYNNTPGLLTPPGNSFKINIYDYNGNLVASDDIDPEASLYVPTAFWVSGNYIVTLIVDGVKTDSTTLIIN